MRPPSELRPGGILITAFPGGSWASGRRPVEAARPVDAKNASTGSLEKPQKTRLFHRHHRPFLQACRDLAALHRSFAA